MTRIKILFLGGVVIALVATAYMTGFLRFNYPRAAVQGIDVSHHQGNVDWKVIPKDKVTFVYIKASEGGDLRDKNFISNWNGARAAGFQTGAYHFFTLCRDGITQARNFRDLVPLEKESLPPAVDLEYVGNCAARPERTKFLKELADFIQEWQVFYMQKPVLYTTNEFYRDYLKDSEFESYPLWVRNVFGKPSRETYPSMMLWQYADNARLKGINGPVDLNIRVSGPVIAP